MDAISATIIIILIAIICYLIYKLVLTHIRYKKLLKNIESESLDFFLDNIRKRGYHFTIKPTKEVLKKKEKKIQTKPKQKNVFDMVKKKR